MRRTPSFKVEIQEPCEQSWSLMAGSGSKRHCDYCNKDVHNFASLTREEIQRLVRKSEGHLCARLTHRQDGSLVTLEPSRNAAPFAGWALSATLAMAPPASLAQTSANAGQISNLPQAALHSTHTAVSGIVTDGQGAVVPNAVVTLLSNGQTIGTTKTNGAGEFEFAVVPSEYQLQVIAAGFAQSSKSLTVTPEKAAASDVSLTPGAQVTIQVTAQTLANSTTMGVMVAIVDYGPWYKRLGYRLRHPISYVKYLFHDY